MKVGEAQKLYITITNEPIYKSQHKKLKAVTAELTEGNIKDVKTLIKRAKNDLQS